MPFTLATFNVKDLFDAPDEVARPFVDAKVEALAAMVERIDADILGLQEVGSVALLERVLDRLPGKGGYGAPVVASADDRGIRCVLLSRRPLRASRILRPERLDFPVFRAGDPPPFGDRLPMRRGVIHAQVDLGNEVLDVIVAHLKSKRGRREQAADGTTPAWSDTLTGCEVAHAELRSLIYRAAEALFLRGLVDTRLADSKDASVALLGDFNDTRDSLICRTLAGRPPFQLNACADAVDEARRFSIMWGGRKDLFDHIFVTPALFARLLSATLFQEHLVPEGPALNPSGTSTAQAQGGENIPPSPHSDYAPFVVRFG